jgi:DNA-binding NarL/FixJ family response regulator
LCSYRLMEQPPAEPRRCTVLVGDDSEIMRRGILRLLKGEPHIQVLGEATSFEQTLQLTSELKPQVVVFSLHMSDHSWFVPSVIKSILSESADRIIAVSAWDHEKAIALAKSYGATVLLTKNSVIDSLIPAVLGSLK